jgi:glycosyltransferase involved in cell wall biosynthesis
MVHTSLRICLSTSTYPPSGGGLAVAAARLARVAASAGYDVHVVTPVQRPGARGECEPTPEDGLVVHRVFHDDPSSLRGVLAVRSAITALDRDAPFSLFHGFFLPAAAVCLDVAERRRRPLVASARGSDVDVLLEQPLTREWILPVLRRATWITAVSGHALTRMAADAEIDGRSSVIYNSVAPLPASDPRCAPHLDRRGVVGTVGEFRKVKDVPLLVRAYATVPAGTRRGLRLVGYFVDDEEEQWSTTLIAELGVSGETVITGRVPHDEIGRELSQMHVFALASAHEGLPNAVLEAARFGLPIVATRVGGIAEVFEDGVSALLVPHGDRDAMGAALRGAIEDAALAMRLSEGAQAVAARLSPDYERSAWLDLYRRLLGGA